MRNGQKALISASQNAIIVILMKRSKKGIGKLDLITLMLKVSLKTKTLLHDVNISYCHQALTNEYERTMMYNVKDKCKPNLFD